MTHNKPRARRVVLGVGELSKIYCGIEIRRSRDWHLYDPSLAKIKGRRVRLVAEIIETRKGRK